MKTRTPSFRALPPALALLLAVVALLVVPTGCRRKGQEKPGVSGEAGAKAGEPVRGGTAVTGWISEPNGINQLTVPASQVTLDVIRRLYLGLAEENADYQDHPPTFAPSLAERWEFSDDHKQLTFHLRPGMVWSDGVPVTAEDVRWTWQAQIHPDIAWESAYKKEAITDVEVVDPLTVRFHFKRAYAAQMLDVNEGQILPKHAWEKLPFAQWRSSSDWFKQHAVVNGPFKIVSWTPQQEVVLGRNERYYDSTRPYLDRVVLRIIPDQASLKTQLLAGDLDFVPQLAPNDAKEVKSNPDLKLIPYWFNLYVFAGWNNTRPPFNDPQVRRALTLGINRQEIVDTLLGEYGRIATTPIPSILWAHDRSIQPLPYDPEEAKRLLAERGWRDSNGDGVLDKGGKAFAFDLISNAGNQARNDAGLMIQNQLKKIGVQATPKVIEFNLLTDQVDKGTFNAAILGFSADTGLDLRGNFNSRSVLDGNGLRYSNPEVDRLMEEVANSRDLLEAKPQLLEIQRLIVRDQPMTLLWESQRITAVSRRLHNVNPNPSASFYRLQDWWIEPKR